MCLSLSCLPCLGLPCLLSQTVMCDVFIPILFTMSRTALSIVSQTVMCDVFRPVPAADVATRLR